MYRKTINVHFSPYYLAAIPFGPRICFEVCAPAHETPEFIILTYGSITKTDRYAGGILVVNKTFQPLLLEPHQTHESARNSFNFWIRRVSDPRVEKAQSTDTDTRESSELAQFSSDGWLNDFSNLSPRKIASDAIIDMKFSTDPLRQDVERAFEQQPDWEKVLLMWASTGFGEFTPLFRWRDQETASRDSKMFLEDRLETFSEDIPF
jgi:hypothetical protein